MKTHTILMVDDEPMVLKLVKRVLKDAPCDVVTAGSGPEGLQRLDEQEISLVISDQRMPGMNGIDFLGRVRVNHPHILTIMLTAYADIQTALKAINQVGIYKFILKPIDPAVFRISIQRALELLDLMNEREVLIERVKAQEAILRDLEREYPGISKLDRDKNGAILSGY
jgi:DNA-binding NtrC family response regulator